MKKSVYVREDVLEVAVSTFREENVELFCAPFEADSQLSEWEKSGFTHGTVSVDSDFFALGSKILVDNLCTQTGKYHCSQNSDAEKHIFG